MATMKTAVLLLVLALSATARADDACSAARCQEPCAAIGCTFTGCEDGACVCETERPIGHVRRKVPPAAKTAKRAKKP